MRQNWLSKVAVVAAISFALMTLKWMPTAAEGDAESRTQTAQMIHVFFQENGFTVEPGASDHIDASRGACSVLVKSVAPQGWNESQMKMLSSDRRLFYSVGGTLYSDDQPVWRTWFEDALQHALLRIGIETPRTYVFGIAPSPACDELDLDWAKLSK